MNNIAELAEYKNQNHKKHSHSQMGFLYFENNSFIPKWLGDEIISRYPVFFDGSHMYFYSDGVYQRDDGGIIGGIVVQMLGDKFKRSRLSETVSYIQNKQWIKTDLINPNNDLINVKNGLLDWKTGDLHPHSPDFLSTMQLPVFYDPLAKAPNIEKFFSDIVTKDTIPLLFEWFGYSMIRSTRHEKAMILTGSGANGKSKLINLYEKLIGKNNISNVALQDLEENRFKLAQLYGKLANVYADIPASALEKTSVFKTVVSGDRVSAEFKGRDSFDFNPFARLLFSANEMPRTADITDGYFRRLLIVEFPNKFGEGGLPKDPNIMDKLTTDSELSGLLNHSLNGLRRLEYSGNFTTNQSTQEAIEEYKKNANPLHYFVEECCIVDEESSCDKQMLYDKYTGWCHSSGSKPLGKIRFYSRMESFLKLLDYRPSSNAKRRYQGLRINV